MGRKNETESHLYLTISFCPRHAELLEEMAEEYSMGRSEVVRAILDDVFGVGPAYHFKNRSEPKEESGEEPAVDELDSAFEEPEKEDDYDLGAEQIEQGSDNDKDDEVDEIELPEENPF